MTLLRCPPGVSERELANALQACEEIAARDRSNLYVTSQFFEDRARYDAFIAMYAVMRVVDDYIDNVPDKARLSSSEHDALKRGLDGWERRIRAAYAGQPDQHPVDVALAAAALTFPVPLQVWLNFVDAMRFDVDHPRFRDFAEFVAYGEGATVAPTIIYVYLLTALQQGDGQYRVSDFDFETCGRQLGLFAYVAHILRDVKQDMAVGDTGLVYLSLSDLQAHGLDEQSVRELIARGTGDARWSALVAELCARAHVMEEQGVALAEQQYARMPPDCAFVLCLIITVYQELLKRIEQEPDAVLRADPMMSAEDKARLATQASVRTGYPLDKVMARLG